MPHKHENYALKIYEDTHKAKALVLTCIDYRFVDDTFFYLNDSKFAKKYDVTALAGASLGYNQKKFKHWRQYLEEHIKLAIELHHIKHILVFDHMDCGAYRIFYPDLEDPKEEEKLHIKNLKKFCKKIHRKFPELKCSGYLISLKDKVTQIF